MSAEQKRESEGGTPPCDESAATSSLPDAPVARAPSRTVGADLSLSEVQELVGQRYRLDAVAGAGGMGRVFRATDTVLQRQVAIKLLRSADPAGSAHRDRLIAEARAMARLNHPGICRVIEIYPESRIPFIVMDWIEGIDLRKAWRGMDVEARLSLFVQVVRAVAAAHSAGLVHRDLKPQNIVVDHRGEPIIIDFGLAQPEAPFAEGLLAGGTPGYAAPEQFAPCAPTTAATDVYALGVILYEMLAGRPPFIAGSIAELARLAREADPPVPETFAPSAPWPLQRICLAAMEREPSRRFADAHAMLADLERYLRGESVAARPSMLEEQFTSQVERQLEETKQWRRQGLITQQEHGRLQQTLTQILRPESPWILDSRRLSVSQVTLYIGGWLVLIALTIGLTMSDAALESYPALRYLVPWFAFAATLSGGIALHVRNERRVSLGYLITAGLALPAATWLLLRETGWLMFPMDSSKEWSALLFDDVTAGLSNYQLLTVALVWLGGALWLRRFSTSSAFTPQALIASTAAWLALWGVLGRIDTGWIGLTNQSAAELGAWLVMLAGALLVLGTHLNEREQSLEIRAGLTRARNRDSWAILTMSVLLAVFGLAMIAYFQPEWYLLPLMFSSELSQQALAFIINGFILQSLSWLLERRATIVRSRLADFIRWITPMHFLGAIVAIEKDAALGQAWWWLVTLAAASLALCYLSVIKQWRPFLISGLFFLAIGYYRAFVRIEEHFAIVPESPGLRLAQILLTAAALLIGALTLFLAWKIPAWLAQRNG